MGEGRGGSSRDKVARIGKFRIRAVWGGGEFSFDRGGGRREDWLVVGLCGACRLDCGWLEGQCGKRGGGSDGVGEEGSSVDGVESCGDVLCAAIR